MFVVFRKVAVDLIELCQREVALTVLGNANLAFDHVASVKVEASDLAGTDVNVVSTCCVTGVRTA